MIRALTFVLSVPLTVLLLVAFGPSPMASELQPGSARRAPLVIVDRTGSTLLGPAHMHLLVYNDGHVVYGSHSAAPGDDHDLYGQVEVAVVHGLHGRLVSAGAMVLADQELQVTDMPLTTVTVLGSAAHAHTFNYWVGEGAYEPIETLLESFVQRHLLGGELPGQD